MKTFYINVLAFFLLITASLNTLLNFLNTPSIWYFEILWFCNISAFILSFAIFFRKIEIINSLMVLGICSQFLWIADILLIILNKLNFNVTPLGRSFPLIYGSFDLFTKIVSILLHTIFIPISVFVTYRFGFYFRSIIWMNIYGIVLQLISFTLTPKKFNINCVFHPCDIINYNLIKWDSNYGTLEYFVTNLLKDLFYLNISFFIIFYLMKIFNKKKLL